MPNDEGGEYQIGYGKPPTDTQFRKGKSGNPKGRPKGSKNSATLLKEMLAEKVIISEGGKRKKITKQAAMYKQLANKAASGDLRSIREVLNETRQIEQRGETNPPETIPFTETENEVIGEIIRRLKDVGGEGDDGGKTD